MGYRKETVKDRFRVTTSQFETWDLTAGVSWVDKAGTLIFASKEYWVQENPSWWLGLALGPPPRIIPFKFLAAGTWIECTRLSDG